MLGRFLEESEMPGRTTSQTYFKLVNKWIKMSDEDQFDEAYEQDRNEKSKYEKNKEDDLGPQLYLLNTNKKPLKELLKNWTEKIPPLFNNIRI